MRAAVAILTMVATVLHLAVGCCGHASHFGGGPTCCAGIEQAGDGCADHDHQHEHDCGARPATLCHTPPGAHATGDDCRGCRCVPNVETDRFQPTARAVSWLAAAFDTQTLAVQQAARGPCEAWRAPAPSELRSPLFERLVV